MSSKIKSLKYNGKWDFSPSIESLENLSIKKEYQLFINGQFQKPVGKKYFPSINPTNEQVLNFVISLLELSNSIIEYGVAA